MKSTCRRRIGVPDGVWFRGRDTKFYNFTCVFQDYYYFCKNRIDSISSYLWFKKSTGIKNYNFIFLLLQKNSTDQQYKCQKLLSFWHLYIYF